ncbi:hypothetical protein EBZ39_05315 [bacterium]|nr:hypothetical protein [bacterium]
MATIALTSIDRNKINGAILITWEALGNADDGAGYPLPFAADITAQFIGTFGGATVKLQGSNDGVNWHPLTKRGGTADMSFTSAALHTANENPAYIRPITSGGTGTDIDVIVAIHARYSKVGY